MNTTPNPASPTGMLTQFTAVRADVLQMTISGRLGIDQVAKILYELSNTGGRFFIDVHTIAPITPAPLYRELSQEELQTLLATLQDEEQHPPAGLDLPALQTFIHLLSQAVGSQPSNRFNYISFGEVVRDTSDAIVGHVGLGIDVVGTIHDANCDVTFEQHVVMLPPGPFQHLSAADKASLAAAIEAFISKAQPQANPLWAQIAEDLRK
jgi:hypothetical protein